MQKNIRGLTLIEVLIALVIIGIAMMAVIKTTSENIQATNYLQSKTIALWVGQDIINQATLNLISLPDAPDTLSQKTNMLGKNWFWQASQMETPNPTIKKIIVKVFAGEDAESQLLITLESYVNKEQAVS